MTPEEWARDMLKLNMPSLQDGWAESLVANIARAIRIAVDHARGEERDRCAAIAARLCVHLTEECHEGCIAGAIRKEILK